MTWLLDPYTVGITCMPHKSFLLYTMYSSKYDNNSTVFFSTELSFSLLQQNLQSQYKATTAVAHLHILHGVLEAAVITLAHCVTTVWTELHCNLPSATVLGLSS